MLASDVAAVGETLFGLQRDPDDMALKGDPADVSEPVLLNAGVGELLVSLGGGLLIFFVGEGAGSVFISDLVTAEDEEDVLLEGEVVVFDPLPLLLF